MIDIVISSYNEPKSTLRAVKSFLNQEIPEDFRIIVVDPFVEVKEFLKQSIKDKRVGFFLDPGEGKSCALNLLFEKLPGKENDIFILTDGDVFVSENTVKEILKAFEDKEVGCVAGKPASLDNRETKFGYWSNVVFSGIHKARKKFSASKNFFECSGYLFAIRKNIIKEFPLDASEDSVVPYLFWKKGYKIAYVPEAEVYVKNPDNLEDWESQKIRNIKGHENLSKLYPEMPRTKSFWNEIRYGFFHTLFYPRNLKEFYWTLQLYKARLSVYRKAFKDIKQDKFYSDGWRETGIESTNTLD